MVQSLEWYSGTIERMMSLPCEKMDTAEMENLLKEAEVGHLATVGVEGPYVIPLHFLYRGGAVFFHCGLRGRKLDNISSDSRVCFHTGKMAGIIPHESSCKYSTCYASVLVEGRAQVVQGKKETESILKELVSKYGGAPHLDLDAKSMAKTLVIKITPSQITGKKNG